MSKPGKNKLKKTLKISAVEYVISHRSFKLQKFKLFWHIIWANNQEIEALTH